MSKIEFAGYIYPDNKACIVCEHVISGESEPNLIVHDFDGMLQFLCGRPNHDPKLSEVVALEILEDRLPSESELPILHPGHYADKVDGKQWIVVKIEDA